MCSVFTAHCIHCVLCLLLHASFFAGRRELRVWLCIGCLSLSSSRLEQCAVCVVSLFSRSVALVSSLSCVGRLVDLFAAGAHTLTHTLTLTCARSHPLLRTPAHVSLLCRHPPQPQPASDPLLHLPLFLLLSCPLLLLLSPFLTSLSLSPSSPSPLLVSSSRSPILLSLRPILLSFRLLLLSFRPPLSPSPLSVSSPRPPILLSVSSPPFTVRSI